MSPQKNIRFPDEVHDRMLELAEKADRSFSYMVIRACEAYYPGKSSALFPNPGQRPPTREEESSS